MLFSKSKSAQEQCTSRANEASGPPPALIHKGLRKMLIYSLLLVFFDVHIAYFQTLILLFFRICSCKLVWELMAWFPTFVMRPVSLLIHTFVYEFLFCMETHKKGLVCAAKHASNQKYIRPTLLTMRQVNSYSQP